MAALLLYPAGHGLSGRVASQWDKGYFNPGNNYDKCQACPYGTTTESPGAGRTLADCKTDLGFGVMGNVTVQCPIGECNSVAAVAALQCQRTAVLQCHILNNQR